MNTKCSESPVRDLEPLLRGKEVDAILGIKRTKRNDLVKRGILERVKIGRCARYTTRSVKFIAENGAA